MFSIFTQISARTRFVDSRTPDLPNILGARLHTINRHLRNHCGCQLHNPMDVQCYFPMDFHSQSGVRRFAPTLASWIRRSSGGLGARVKRAGSRALAGISYVVVLGTHNDIINTGSIASISRNHLTQRYGDIWKRSHAHGPC